MSSASRRLLVHLVARRWPIHAIVVCGYAFALVGTAHGWSKAMWMYYSAAMLGLFRVDEGALLSERSLCLLPLSEQQRERLLWGWVFLAPMAVLAFLLALTTLVSGLIFSHSVELSARIALYLLAPFSLTLLATRLPASRAVASARMAAAFVFLVAAVADLSRAAPSAGLLLIAALLVLAGISFPIWASFRFRGNDRRRRDPQRIASAQSVWPKGILAMVWARVRASVPSMLVMSIFVLVMATFSSRHRGSLAATISLTSLVVMSYIWMSNWRWLCHFRSLRCLPLSGWQLTVLTLGISIVPTATVWVAQYAVTGLLLGANPLHVQSLLALLAVQLLTVPVFLYAPGWLRLNWLAAVLPMAFLALQSTAALIGFEQFQPWIETLPRIWLVVFVCALIGCAAAAVVWTYHEITHGRHAYRVQSDNWAPPTWAWPE